MTQSPVPQVVLKAFDEIKPAYLLSVPLVLEKIFNIRVIPILQKPFVKVMMKVPVVRILMYQRIRHQLMKALGGNIYEVMMGGAALNKEIEKILHKIKFPFTIGYGMTECGPMITYSDWKEHRLGSCGKAVVNMEVKVNSNDPQHEPGEIVTRGINSMLGYYKNADATAATIDEDGWLHTGDLAYRDEDGFYFIAGRKKRFLKLFGNRISLDYVETLLKDKLKECVCVGDDSKLIIYTTDNDFNEDEIIDFIVGRTKIVRTVFFVRHIDAIPRSESGKIQYKQLSLE